MILSSFIDPTAFWWALLLPIIILFYFLKLKRDECTIPSTLLWKKVIEDSRVNSLFSKLKENLLLFFQLFLMILLILALARPFLFQKQEEKKIVLLIDRSASMGAIEENNRSRMDRAKEMAEKLVDGLSQNDSMMIISFAKNAAVHQSFTGIKTLLKERIRSLSETQEESRLEDAILIAQSMLQKVASPVLYIITDGAIFDIESIKEKYMLEEGKKKKQIVMPQLLFVGKSTSNAAVLGFEIREDSQGNKQGFVRVQNLGDKPIKGYMEILLNGEAFVQETKSVDLGPGDTSGIFFPNLPIQRGRAETHFVVT
ncbi:MAG: BatA domain-containing protein, partial [Candidatus Brocadiae bacterium]|nr:BatA domain-containing protein [Candidatus Brocadiia bacterium]